MKRGFVCGAEEGGYVSAGRAESGYVEAQPKKGCSLGVRTRSLVRTDTSLETSPAQFPFFSPKHAFSFLCASLHRGNHFLLKEG